mgnify:CR=1 FL=1
MTPSSNIEKTEVKSKKTVRHNYLFAVGRRKTSIARIRLFKSGNGQILVNGKDYKQYFPQLLYQNMVVAPLKKVGQLNAVNLSIKINGGGAHGQAEAARHGISRVLLKIDKNFRQTLKPLGFLKRDPRMKERKKPGLKRARRAPQWQKR